MCLGEAQGCSKIEKIAIAHTALTRSNDGEKWSGQTLKKAILKPSQYSAFNPGRNKKLKNPLAYDEKEFRVCLKLSKEVLDGKHPDPTNGARFYFNPKRVKNIPSWSKKLKQVKITNNPQIKIHHKFYK